MECKESSMECKKALWSVLWSVHKSLWSVQRTLWSVTKNSMECNTPIWSVINLFILLFDQPTHTHTFKQPQYRKQCLLLFLISNPLQEFVPLPRFFFQNSRTQQKTSGKLISRVLLFQDKTLMIHTRLRLLSFSWGLRGGIKPPSPQGCQEDRRSGYPLPRLNNFLHRLSFQCLK